MERVTTVERRGTSLENVHREAVVAVEVTKPVLIVEKKDTFQENVPLAEVDAVVVEEGAEAVLEVCMLISWVCDTKQFVSDS